MVQVLRQKATMKANSRLSIDATNATNSLILAAENTSNPMASSSCGGAFHVDDSNQADTR